MSSAQVPDFPSRKVGTSARGGSIAPDFGAGAAKSSARGQYPKDGPGTPKEEVGSKGPSGDPKQIVAVPETYARPAPKKSPRFSASRDI